MTWPFILNTVSPWPSVRKWLLILALNLPACQCEEGRSRGKGWRELGQLRSLTSRPVPVINSPSLHPPPPHRFSPGGACSLSLQIKATGPLLLPVCDGWESELFLCTPTCQFSPLQVRCSLRKERRVEWQPDGSHNKTVIERYVIMTISSRVKWYQRDIHAKKTEEREPLLIKNSAQRGDQILKLEACLAWISCPFPLCCDTDK